MEKQTYAKIFKWLSAVLLLVSVGILVWGFSVGFETNDGQATNVLLYWAYAMVGIVLAAVVFVGIGVAAATNPKSLISILAVVVGTVVVCYGAYLLASGAPAIGYSGDKAPSAFDLKLTDTILNLTYLVGGATILAVIAGEIIMGIRSSKKA